MSISLTYAVSSGLSIPATSHQFKPISSSSPPHQHQTAEDQTKPKQPNQGGDELAASNPIINTPRLDKTPPSQKLWIFKQFNFSGNKSSFGRQQNAQNTQLWHLNNLRPKENSQLLIFQYGQKCHLQRRKKAQHWESVQKKGSACPSCKSKIQINIWALKEGVGLSILPRPDGFSQKPGENHSALHLLQISISSKDYSHFLPKGGKYIL